jgi:hypothetical protein
MPLHPHLGPSQQCARREQGAVSPEPICKPRARLPQCLAGSFPLDLEGAMTGFAPKDGHPQERQLLGFLSPAVGIRPCIAPTFEGSRFLRRQLQMARLHALAETCEKIVGIRLRLEPRHTVIGTPVPRRVTPAVPPHPALEPAISDIVEGDSGKERREHRALRRTDLRGLHEPVFHDPCLAPPVAQA